MKKLYALIVALLGIMGCSEETITYTNPVPGDEPSGVTAELGISSKNTWFDTEDNLNGSIGFKSLGGEVVVDIRTNTTWKYAAVNADWLTIEKDDVADQLVLSCEGNKVETEQKATITITAGDKTATIAATQNPYGTLEIAASKNNFLIPAVGELTAEFEVQSTDEDWIFETQNCPWLLLEQEGNKIKMTLDPNEEIEDRETTFQLIAGEGGGNPASETIRVTQDRAVYIRVSLKTIPLSPTPTESDKKELAVESNYDWEYIVSENSEWLSATKTEQGLSLTAETNSSGSSRTASITVSAGDGKQNQTEQVITVSQSGLDLDAFILGIDITQTSLKTYLPFDKAIDATIDWGDGNVEENVTSTYPTHTYTDPGYYIVSVKGSVPSLNSYDIPTYGLGNQFVEVYNWGRTGLTSMSRAFQNCRGLERIPADNTEAFAKVTAFNYAFCDCRALGSIPDGLFDHATEAKTYEYCFQNCVLIEEVPADLLYNSPGITSVCSLFSGTAISTIDENFFSHNTELTDCSIIFSNSKMTSVPEKLFANNKKVTTFNSLFANTPSFESVPAGLFANNPEVESFRMLFSGTGLKTIPDGLFANNKKVENFQSTFSKAPIQSVPEDLFEGCDQVTTFMSCFTGCSKLQSIPAGLFRNSGAFETVTKTAFNNILKDCAALTEVPAGIFDGFSKVTAFNDAFSGCTSLATLPAGLFATNTAVTSFSNTFKSCTSLKGIPAGLFQGLNKVTSFSGLFAGCSGLEEIGANIISGCTACKNISSMFKDCSNLRTISAEAFAGAPAITSISSLFENCTLLENVPEEIFADMPGLTTATSAFAASGLKTAPADLFRHNQAITGFGKVFQNCAALTTLPDGLFTGNPKVTVYSNAMENCTALESVGVLFGTSTAAVKCDLLFSGCTTLKTLPAGIFDGLTGATAFNSAFAGCTALETLPGELFAKNVNVTTVALCFQNCTRLKAVPSRLFNANTKTKTLSEMFTGCSGIESIAADAFTGLNGTSLNFMKAFMNCTSLKELPDGLFKTQQISNYTSLFSGCTGLLSVGSEVFNCASATTFNSVFDGCTSLRQVGEKMLVGATKLTSILNLFRNCSSLTAIPVSMFDEAVKLKTLTSTFEGCISLEGESPYTVVNGVRYHLYDRTPENAAASGLTAITAALSSFKGCTKLSDYDKIPTTWKE